MTIKIAFVDITFHRQRVRKWSALALAAILGLPESAMAQIPGPQTAPQGAVTRNLKVIALAGNQEMNDLENKVMAPLVVEVRDQNDRPVEGADVTFRFPLEGPTATFADQKSAATFRTNPDGQAAAVGWMANAKVGSFKVQVTAFRGSEEGAAVITMTNVTRITEATRTKEKHWWSSKWGKVAIVAGVAAVAATAAILATRSGSSTKVITGVAGSPTIGAPQ